MLTNFKWWLRRKGVLYWESYYDEIPSGICGCGDYADERHANPWWAGHSPIEQFYKLSKFEAWFQWFMGMSPSRFRKTLD